MTSLHSGQIALPGAPLGPDDPLPLPHRLLENPFTLGDGLPEAIRHGASFGRPRSMHPYLMQNRYSREREPITLPTVILDNGHLRATFTPTLGGRLWSLVDIASGRELLHANAVLQPANLALRNAWFAGGVEWNIGTKGHAAHTMAPMHAARLTGPGGVPMLRMWEMDRLREVVCQVDAWLPADSRALHVYVRIQNPGEHEVPMYWWSNAAVPEAPDVRVLVPATTAYATGYDGTISEVPVPVHNGADRTFSTRSTDAADYFYDTTGTTHPWIAAVDSSGHGLAQVSTARLPGRKLFLWGTGPGGQHWQRWLSPDGPGPYLEIQAGITATQFEHVMMPGRTNWDWVETYGDIAADATRAHDEDWDAATTHVAGRVDALLPDAGLDAVLTEARRSADRAPEEMLHRGSGWGALESLVRSRSGRHWIADDGGTPFAPESLGEEQLLWEALVRDPRRGQELLAAADPATPPASYVVGQFWEDLLSSAAPGWLRDYHLGVLAHSRGEDQRAEECYRASLADRRSAWALRGLAQVAAGRGDHAGATDPLSDALALADDQPTMLLEAMAAAIQAGAPQRALDFAGGAPREVRSMGRVRLLEGFAAHAAGDRDRAEQVLAEDIIIPDVREGELALSDLWAAVHPGRAVPERYDFRMRHP
ncbi:DUF5107 domain-containing protein [Pseudactinotalea sp. Z1739]|uniref:DUF5107 domain-containing protein n=1 Tax=Pseudactinotalea sp. Z1739 TaxID=3413028 RepID=UPI003C79AA9A